jgi:hypothetical protein
MLEKMLHERSLPVIHLLVAAWPAVSELDTWRAANLLIHRHSPDAEFEAARLADLMLDRGEGGMAADQASDRGATGSTPGRASLSRAYDGAFQTGLPFALITTPSGRSALAASRTHVASRSSYHGESRILA